ncbi:hypothetical protein [Methanobrevibacter olleyae]|uniref:Uncharacterized protein n=1 Tax=Methanobrevibacter olleyae TaxID=294671 RepID=A0A126R1R2_METOL|nr:hypothetical protein [Methanobrevibacter olleyae]AMK16333.1 hypothetical protein YLM1_1778 [Methanobrevibacter olleyae]
MSTESIDYNSLYHAVANNLDDSIIEKYDLDGLLRTATLCWDGTGVMVSGSDFSMVFDLVNYDLLDYTGFDA